MVYYRPGTQLYYYDSSEGFKAKVYVHENLGNNRSNIVITEIIDDPTQIRIMVPSPSGISLYRPVKPGDLFKVDNIYLYTTDPVSVQAPVAPSSSPNSNGDPISYDENLRHGGNLLNNISNISNNISNFIGINGNTPENTNTPENNSIDYTESSINNTTNNPLNYRENTNTNPISYGGYNKIKRGRYRHSIRNKSKSKTHKRSKRSSRSYRRRRDTSK